MDASNFIQNSSVMFLISPRESEPVKFPLKSLLIPMRPVIQHDTGRHQIRDVPPLP